MCRNGSHNPRSSKVVRSSNELSLFVIQIKKVPFLVPEEQQSSKTYEASRLTFKHFNLAAVLEKGARLIGSEGTEFDCHDEVSTGDDSSNASEKDRLMRQRLLLNDKLGLNQSTHMLGIMNISDLVTLDDMRNTSNKYEPNKSLMPVQDVLTWDSSNPTCGGNSGGSSLSTHGQGAGASLSCREMNRAKRKARQYQSQTSTSNSGINSTSCSNSSSNLTATTTTVSATFSRSSSLSNGSLSDEQPETKKSKMGDTEYTYNSNG